MDENVVDGEIVASEKGSAGGADIIINMEGLIKSHIAQIDKLSEEARKLKDMLDDIFENDPTYKEHDEKAKEAAKVKSKTKSEILKRPQAADLNEKIKSLKSQIKENESSLSDYLQEYARLAGVNEIEGEDGEVREIVYTAKLIKKAFKS